MVDPESRHRPGPALPHLLPQAWSPHRTPPPRSSCRVSSCLFLSPTQCWELGQRKPFSEGLGLNGGQRHQGLRVLQDPKQGKSPAMTHPGTWEFIVLPLKLLGIQGPELILSSGPPHPPMAVASGLGALPSSLRAMLSGERKEGGSPRFGKLHLPVGLWINSPRKQLAKLGRRWPSAASVK